MARIDSKFDDILTRLVDRIVDQITEAGPSNTYISIDPDSPTDASSASDYIFVVSPPPSMQFDAGLFDGGEQSQAQVRAQIAVTVHSPVQFDQVGRDVEFLTSATVGIIEQWRLLVKALAGHDLQDASGNELLAQPLFPDDTALYRPTRRLGSMQLGVAAIFNLDLT